MDIEVARELVAAWHSREKWWSRWTARIQRACLSAGVVVRDVQETAEYFGLPHENCVKCPVELFLARYFRAASNALFDGASDERVIRHLTCVKAALHKSRPRHRPYSVTRCIRMRELDKRHDWRTVK